MRKGVAVSSIVLSTALALTGCMSNQGDVGNKNIRPNSYRAQGLNGTRFADDGANERNRINGTQRMNNNVTGLHANTNMELSQDIANRLTALPEIQSAYVMLTNNNAYVAVVEDRDAGRTGTGNAGTGTTGNVGTGNVGTGFGNNNVGTNSLPNVTPHSMGAVPNRNTARDGYRGFGAGALGNATTGTGATGTDTSAADVSDELKNKVADVVKSMNPSVNNVYVTANADFYSRMQGFANDVGNGRPIQGLISQFNALVERVFPQRAGTTDGGLPSRIAPTAPSPAARTGGMR